MFQINRSDLKDEFKNVQVKFAVSMYECKISAAKYSFG